MKVRLAAGGGRSGSSDSGRILFSIPELEIPSGTRLLVHGPSGQGKTTFLHLLGGLLTPNSGSVKLGEHDLALLPDKVRSALRRQHMGLIFQKLNLLDHLTAAENVQLALGAQARGDLVREALSEVGMHEKAQQRTATLSLGEQQRVAVARILVRPPEVILADEPTSSLDGQSARWVIEALLRVARSKTIIVVSHDERIQSYFSDRRALSQVVSL